MAGIGGLEITIARGRPVVPLPEGDRYLGFMFARAATADAVERSLRAAHARLRIRIEPPRPSRSTRASVGAVRVLLISTYELGHQPLHVASPAAALRRAGHEVRCLDLSVQPWDPDALEWAQAVGFSVPMHTAMRLALNAGAPRAPRASPAADLLLRALCDRQPRAGGARARRSRDRR